MSIYLRIILSNFVATDVYGQFCTTPPVGILLGSRSKSLGWIPTVSIPNPDQPPLMIFLTQPYFCTKRKLNKHVIATSSQQNPNNFFFHSVFHFICWSWYFGGMNDWLQEWKSESSLKQRMGELFIWHREGSIGPRFIIKVIVRKFLKYITCSKFNSSHHVNSLSL